MSYQPDLALIFEEIDVLQWLVGRVWKLLRHVAWRSPTPISHRGAVTMRNFWSRAHGLGDERVSDSLTLT